MNIIQIAAAVYILVVFAAGMCGVVKYVVSGEPDSYNIKGWPAALFYLACVVCAITTLVEVA